MKTIILLITMLSSFAMAAPADNDLIVTCKPTKANAPIQEVKVFGSTADVFVRMEVQLQDGQKLQDDEAVALADLMDPETEGELIGYGSDTLDLDINFKSGLGSQKAVLVLGATNNEIAFNCIWK